VPGRDTVPHLEGDSVVEILDCLKKYGQRLDTEIAKEIGVPLEAVRARLTALAATGAVITCNLTRFEKGKRMEALQCRVSGYVPALAPGRKPSPKP
jgi:transcription initiation factor IIE alpha subunit